MAGGIDWFRWHHGTTGDRKLALIAKRAGARLGDVIAMWAIVLEQASAAVDRGNPGHIDFEAIDLELDLPEGQSIAIYDAMQGRGLIDPTSKRVAKWEERQVKRERDTDNSTERTRRFKDRERQKKEGERQNEGEEHQKNARGEERREEGNSEAKASAAPSSAKDRVWSIGIAVLGESGRSLLGRLVKQHGEDVVDRAIASTVKEQPGDAKSWLVKACEAEAKAKKRDDQLGGQGDLLDDPKPQWALDAGFATRFEAENEGCHKRNAHQFRDGRRVQ